MQLGLGVLGWSPEVFWDSTITELYSAIEGWQESHGIEKEPKRLSDNDVKDLLDMMEKFPDRKA